MNYSTALLPDLTQRREADRDAARFTNYAICIAKGLDRSAYPQSFQRGVIEAMSTSNTSALQAESMAFVNLLNTRTVLGRMQTFTIPAPPFTTIATITDDPDAPWVGELAPVPLVQLTTSAAARTDATKFQVMVAVVQEWLRAVDPRGAAWSNGGSCGRSVSPKIGTCCPTSRPWHINKRQAC